MPEISRFYGIIIRMFYNDHNPPHFHVIYQEDEACVDVETLELLEGNLPKRARALAIEWALEHRHELMETGKKPAVTNSLLKLNR